MSEAESTQIGRLAVERGLLSFEHLAEAIREHERRRAAGADIAFGEMLIAMELLTRRQLEALQPSAAGGAERKQPIKGYELLRRLGEGGMGATYLARQLSMDKLVALKVLRRNLARNSEFLSRFQREARLAGRLEHPNIVRALDVGESGGFNFLVMEYVQGRSAAEIMPPDGGMEESAALRLCLQVARALEYAHRNGVVHRDVKPDNILVSDDGSARLCDFGLARDTAAETRLTQTGVTMGTPHYASPEQARGQRDVDIRSDIYSLGATLYHLVTGRTPFSGSSAAVVMTKHLTEQLPWPSDVNPAVSENCSRLIARMMAKEAGDRYQTPAELIADMQLVAGGLPPAAADPGLGRSAVAMSGTISVRREPRPVRAAAEVRPVVPQAEPGEFPEVDGVQWVDAEAGAPAAEIPLEPGESGEPAAEGGPAAPFAIRRRPGARGARAGEAYGRQSGSSGRLGFALCAAGLLAVGGIVWLALYIAGSRLSDPGSGAAAAPEQAPVFPAAGQLTEAERRLHGDVAGLFKGRVQFSPKDLALELTYDFSSPDQLNDWRPSPNGEWAVENGRLVCRKATVKTHLAWKGELDPQDVALSYRARGTRDLNCAVCCRLEDSDPAGTGWRAIFGQMGERRSARLEAGTARGPGLYVTWKDQADYQLSAVKSGKAWQLRLGRALLLDAIFESAVEGRGLVLWTNAPAEYDEVVIRGRLDRAWLDARLGPAKAGGPGR